MFLWVLQLIYVFCIFVYVLITEKSKYFEGFWTIYLTYDIFTCLLYTTKPSAYRIPCLRCKYMQLNQEEPAHSKFQLQLFFACNWLYNVFILYVQIKWVCLEPHSHSYLYTLDHLVSWLHRNTNCCACIKQNKEKQNSTHVWFKSFFYFVVLHYVQT